MRNLPILLALAAATLSAQTRKTQNIVLVTSDGLRWQEVFSGIDPLLMNEKAAGMDRAQALREKLWAPSAGERRQRLMPFFWKTLAPRGVALGNREKGSAVQVTNAFRVSYPGFSEILTCRAQDEKIRGNDMIQNPTPTVLELVRQKRNLANNQAALLASWEVFKVIGESRPGSVFINAGYEPASGTPRMEELSRIQFEALAPWRQARHDFVTFEMALEYLKTHRPRILYIALDETDDWAHDKRYDRVLEMIQYFDRSLERLWQTLQSIDQYRDRTTLILTADHGRGSQLTDWTSHGAKVDGADYIWMAALGPDTPARGEAANSETVYQRDISATILELLGLEWREYCAGGGRPVKAIVGQ